MVGIKIDWPALLSFALTPHARWVQEGGGDETNDETTSSVSGLW